MYNIPLIATIAYFCIGLFLMYKNNKICIERVGRTSSAREDIILVFLWGIFIVMDLFEFAKYLYLSRSNKALDTFEAIEADQPRKLIAFAGISGTGKDTCADYLVREHNYIKFSFAALLKALCQVMFGHKGLKGEDYYNDNRDARKDVLWTDSQDKEVTPVDVWVSVGTKMREVHEDVWLDVLSSQMEYDVMSSFAIADCRHPNELKRIQELGGKVYYVTNSGVKPNPKAKMDHLITADMCDGIIVNEGTLEELYAKLDELQNKKALTGTHYEYSVRAFISK